MTIDKAIEILQDEVDQRSNKMPPYVLDALTLSIEALIRVRNDRINPGAYRNLLLPNETPSPANPLSDEEVKRLQESPLGRIDRL